MKVIHDNELGSVAMIPLIVDWDIARTCQVENCEDKTNAIVCFTANETPENRPLHIGICEKHHAESERTGKFHYTVVGV